MQSSSPDLLQAIQTQPVQPWVEGPSYSSVQGCMASPILAMAMLRVWVAAPKLLLTLMFQSLHLREPCREPSSALEGGLLPYSWEKAVGMRFVPAAFCTASDHLYQSKACPSLYQAKKDLLIVL